MKYITLIIGLLVMGCATLTPEEKALRESVVGEYKYMAPRPPGAKSSVSGPIRTRVFLENGVYEAYYGGEKQEEHRWKIVNDEIHVIRQRETDIFELGLYDGFQTIKNIAYIDVDGKRKDLTGGRRPWGAYKKIK